MKKLTTEEFILKAKDIHGLKYDYSLSEYTISHNPLRIICKVHGVFEQVANKHLSGKGCPECGLLSRAKKRSKDLLWFVEKAKKVHLDRYNYENSVLSGMLNPIEIECKVHGVFSQVASNHLKGHGCDKCARELTGTHDRLTYIKNCRSRHHGMSNLYLVKLKSQDECFYKVGISVNDIETRFSKSEMPYEVSKVLVINGEAGFIWDLEKSLFKLLKEQKYQPKAKFNGWTECFAQVPKDVLKYLKSLNFQVQQPLIA